MVAGWVWWSCVSAATSAVVWGLVSDWWLVVNERPTISDWLRVHPWQFWGPVIGFSVSLMTLAIHLFIRSVRNSA